MKTTGRSIRRTQIAKTLLPIAIITALSGCAPLKETIIKKFSHKEPMPQVVIAKKTPEQIRQELTKKVEIFKEKFCQAYPTLSGRKWLDELKVKFVPEVELSKLLKKGGPDVLQYGKNACVLYEQDVEKGEIISERYILTLPENGNVRDNEIAELIAYFVFGSTSSKLYFGGDPFYSGFIPTVYSKLFANKIEKGDACKGSSQGALVAFFLDQLGEQELLRCYSEGDWNPFIKAFDGTFGEGSFDKMREYGISTGHITANYFIKLVREKEDEELIKKIIKTAESFGYDVRAYFGE